MSNETKIVYEPMSKLSPAGYNPRNISADMMLKLKSSLLTFGIVDPIIANKRTKNIVGGHQRFFAIRSLLLENPNEAKSKGITDKVPVVWVDLPEDKEKQLNVILNRISGTWDFPKLFEVLTDVESSGIDVNLTGWDWESLELLSGIDRELGNISLKDISESVPQEEKILLSKDDNEYLIATDKTTTLKSDMIFPSTHMFGIPDLLEDKLLSLPAEMFQTYTGRTQTINQEGWLHCLCHKLHPYRQENKRTLVSFATWDEYFDAVWNDIVAQTIRLMNLNVGAITTPDFSTWWNEPIAVQIWAVYKQRYVGRFWQESGMSVIPLVETPSMYNRDFVISGVPKNLPCLFIQCQNHKNSLNFEHWIDGFKFMLKELTPQSLIVYAADSYKAQITKLGETLCPKVVCIDSWSATRKPQRKSESSQNSKVKGGDIHGRRSRSGSTEEKSKKESGKKSNG